MKHKLAFPNLLFATVNRQKAFLGIAIALVLLPAVNTFAAVVITWGSVQNANYYTPTQVSTNGTYVDSFAYTTGSTLVNTVTFNGYTGHTGSVNNFSGGITVNLGTNTANQQFQQINPTHASSVNSYAILVAKTSYVYQPVAARISLTGLTSGYTYEIQLWQAPWDAFYPTNYSSSADFTTGVSGSVTSAGSTIDGKSAPQFVVGTFVADSSTQAIYFKSTSGTTFVTGPAAGQLRLIGVPEPQTWALAGLGVLAVFFRRRHKQKMRKSLLTF